LTGQGGEATKRHPNEFTADPPDPA